MEYEDYQDDDERECDHDDDVMCASRFFDKTLCAHLDRQRLHAVVKAKKHWIFAITPECISVFLRLQQLHAERGAMQDLEVVTLPSLPMAPILLCIPRDKVFLEDLTDLVDFSKGSLEAYESKAYITITSLGTNALNQALSNWINLDHLVN
jgi:hypothetical protein